MKKLTLALLYNIRHIYPDPNDPQAQLETDFDDQNTIDAMIKNLEGLGHTVIPIEANKGAYEKLKKNVKKIDLAFNYSLGIFGNDRYAQLPAMLEMLQIPYTGSGPLTQALVLNKSKMKQMLMSYEVPTLPYQLFYSPEDMRYGHLSFPLIVKPVAQGSSAGITVKSIVNDDEELATQVKFICDTFHQPALVEPFLKWREFSVGLVGNPPRVLPIIESDYSLLPSGYPPIDSLEIKWTLEEKIEEAHLICPAKISKGMKEEIERISLRVWSALDIRDLCRIDMRTDENDNLYILDVNSPPGMQPPEISTTSYLPFAAGVAGIKYPQLLDTIINSATKRYGITS